MFSESKEEAESKLATGRRIRVLVCTESGFLRDSIITILHSFRFVTVVNSGLETPDYLFKISEAQPEMILVDCSSTQPDSMSFLQAVHEHYPQIQCLAITDTFQMARQANESGTVEVLTNGFTSQDLSRAIQRVNRSKQNNPADSG